MHTLVNLSLFKLPLKFNGQAIGDQNVNQDLWKQALDNTDLYSALKEFKVVGAKQAPFALLKQNSDIKNTADLIKINLKGSVESEKLLNELDGDTQPPSYFLNKQANEISPISKLIQLPQVAKFFNSFHHVETVVESPTHNSISNMSLSTLNRIKWFDKNALITLVDSNLEVWLRDSTAGRNVNLKEMLSGIKHSMSDICATLVKVSINGKVVYEKKNGF
jgi:hypothetical protein